MTTWRKLISICMQDNGDSWDKVQFTTLTDLDLDAPFNDDYDTIEGAHFTLWTAYWVYFPACYDGLEWVESVPRNPCSFACRHIGEG